jgi:hypothetical protein
MPLLGNNQQIVIVNAFPFDQCAFPHFIQITGSYSCRRLEMMGDSLLKDASMVTRIVRWRRSAFRVQKSSASEICFERPRGPRGQP